MSARIVISLSGGKDSTAMGLLAQERQLKNVSYVFADTGNEHELTYQYLDYLTSIFGEIRTVKADFTLQIYRKREYIKEHWGAGGISQSHIDRALELLHPTGIPMLDLCLWKGRFPSTRARFCSEELKSKVILNQVHLPLLKQFERVVSWQGVRRNESTNRAKLAIEEEDARHWGLVYHRPILEWGIEQVFAIHRKCSVKPNPLYSKGMSRVGCMPCIHCNKNEMFEISRRFPAEVDRIAEWERLVSAVSKRGISTFMAVHAAARHLGTGVQIEDISIDTHGIHAYASWSKTAHGGKQFDLLKLREFEDVPVCSSVYGLCE